MLSSHHSPVELVLPAGISPATSRFEAGRSICLSYGSNETGRHGRSCTDKPLLLRQRGMLSSRHVPLAAPAGFAPTRLRSERSRLLLPHGAMNGAPARTSTGSTPLGLGRSVCLSYRGKLVRPVGVAPTSDRLRVGRSAIKLRTHTNWWERTESHCGRRDVTALFWLLNYAPGIGRSTRTRTETSAL